MGMSEFKAIRLLGQRRIDEGKEVRDRKFFNFSFSSSRFRIFGLSGFKFQFSNFSLPIFYFLLAGLALTTIAHGFKTASLHLFRGKFL